MSLSWFWGTPMWAEYCLAYNGSPPHQNIGVAGNLIIPIKEPLQMWRALTKGHRADVRRAEREGHIAQVLYGGNFPAEMNAFRELHAKAAGRATRSLETWKIQQAWIWDGVAMLAYVGEPMIAAGLFICYEKRAYYASAARDPEHANEGAAHLLLWKAMCWLHLNGYIELDMGPIPDPGEDAKVLNVFRFKKHFGGEAKVAA